MFHLTLRRAATTTRCRRRALSTAAASSPFGHLSDDHVALKDGARRYFMDTLNPLFRRMDDEDYFPPEVWPDTLGAQGYMGLTIPEKYGGAGLDFLSAGLIGEEMHYANSSIGISHSAHDNLCANNIHLNGTEDQRRRFLPGLCDGSLIGALGMSEPGAGSDAIGSMATRAVRVAGGGSGGGGGGGDHFVLNGSKLWCAAVPSR